MASLQHSVYSFLNFTLIGFFIGLIKPVFGDVCNGGYCDGDCCFDGYDFYCCYSVVYEWWFWLLWVFFFLIIVTSCCAAAKRRRTVRLRQAEQVVVVQQGYTTGQSYGTLGAEVATPPYMQPVGGANNQGYVRYDYPGPVPPYQPPQQPQPGQQAPNIQQADATAPTKQNEVQYDPNEKPPPYYSPPS